MTVFPAPAGMNRATTLKSQRLTRVPRASGDEPLGELFGGEIAPCSPRQRG